MESGIVQRPLLTWDESRLRIDLDMLELWLNRTLPPKVTEIRRLQIVGSGDAVDLVGDLELKGFPARVTAHLRELRLYRRFFGCKVESVHGPFGLPIPLGMVASLIDRVPGGLVRLDRTDRVLLVDLRRWLPGWLELRIHQARCDQRWLELEVSPGLLTARLTE
ncbi:MAG: hypothetical protein ACM3O7_06090 [Acidobacteriota bacterium]